MDTILVVEDEQDILDLIEYTLSKEGYDVICCLDTSNVQDILDEEDVALIGDSDGIAVFNTYSNAQEIVGMLVTACVLTKHCDGVLLSDFFEDELIGPDECMGFLQDRMPGIREQFNGPSKMRR